MGRRHNADRDRVVTLVFFILRSLKFLSCDSSEYGERKMKEEYRLGTVFSDCNIAFGRATKGSI